LATTLGGWGKRTTTLRVSYKRRDKSRQNRQRSRQDFFDLHLLRASLLRASMSLQ
jgi:hypothetical protein